MTMGNLLTIRPNLVSFCMYICFDCNWVPSNLSRFTKTPLNRQIFPINTSHKFWLPCSKSAKVPQIVVTSLVLRWAVLPWTRNFSQSGWEWFWTTLCCPLSPSSETRLLNLTCRHHLIADSLLSTQRCYMASKRIADLAPTHGCFQHSSTWTYLDIISPFIN